MTHMGKEHGADLQSSRGFMYFEDPAKAEALELLLMYPDVSIMGNHNPDYLEIFVGSIRVECLDWRPYEFVSFKLSENVPNVQKSQRPAVRFTVWEDGSVESLKCKGSYEYSYSLKEYLLPRIEAGLKIYKAILNMDALDRLLLNQALLFEGTYNDPFEFRVFPVAVPPDAPPVCDAWLAAVKTWKRHVDKNS